MASNSYVDFSMKNRVLFQELEKIGIKFNVDGSKCKLASGEVYKWCFEDGDGLPYLGFTNEYMIGMYLEYFLGCGNSSFGYQFMKILTENGFFESDYDFVANPFDETGCYDSGFYKQFHITKKLTDFDCMIENAYVKGVEYDGEITAFYAAVSNGVMIISDLQFEIDEDEIGELDEFWDMTGEDDDFTIKKILQDGCWIEQ